MRSLVLVLQIFWLLFFLRTMLTFRNLNLTLQWMKNCEISFLYSSNITKNKKLIQILSKLIPKCTCLIQAVAFKVLSRGYIKTELVIGISKKSTFESHAWICSGDEIIFGEVEDDMEFTRLASFS